MVPADIADRVTVTPSGCWLWRGAKDKDGYGALYRERAHRWAWRRFNGPIPRGMCVLHRCDTPPCVNPEHLFLGTNQDNMDDKTAKGRQARGDRHGARLHPERVSRGDAHYSRREPYRLARGDQNGNASLTRVEVVAIRYVRAFCGASYPRIAAAFGVTKPTVRDICLGRTWRHEPYLLGGTHGAE